MQSCDDLYASRFARADGQLALCHVDTCRRLCVLFSKFHHLVEQLPDCEVCCPVERLFRKWLGAIIYNFGDNVCMLNLLPPEMLFAPGTKVPGGCILAITWNSNLVQGCFVATRTMAIAKD